MEKHYCDICGKEFKWFNNVFRIVGDNYYKEYDFCSKCISKIESFIKQMQKGDTNGK